MSFQAKLLVTVFTPYKPRIIIKTYIAHLGLRSPHLANNHPIANVNPAEAENTKRSFINVPTLNNKFDTIEKLTANIKMAKEIIGFLFQLTIISTITVTINSIANHTMGELKFNIGI